MYFSLTESICSLILLWLLWKLIGSYLWPTALDNIPGPSARSLLTGMSFFSLLDFSERRFAKGDLERLLHREHGRDFVKSLTDDFGPIVRVQGLLGVSSPHTSV